MKTACRRLPTRSRVNREHPAVRVEYQSACACGWEGSWFPLVFQAVTTYYDHRADQRVVV